MKNWKKRTFLGMVVILVITLAMTACAGRDGGNDDDRNGDGNLEGSTSVGGHDSICNNQHNLATVCMGECRGLFKDARGKVSSKEMDSYDQATWASWHNRGGDYHNKPFSIEGQGPYKTYSINIDGNIKGPCFNEQDRTAGL
jgi:hypothetical protein